MEARGGVEPRAFPPSSLVRFRRPTPGTRARLKVKRKKWKGKKYRDSQVEFVLFTFAFFLVVWCPRKDLNLQPLVCRTSAPSVELLGQEMVVGVGIEPTFRAFQTRANPSQLSDQGLFATDEHGSNG